MEQFNVINHLGSEVPLLDRQSYITQSTKLLKREVCKMHFQHFVSWLSRAAVISTLFYLGNYIIGGGLGGAITWTAGFLFVYLLLYISRGHSRVRRFSEAKMYWLLDDAAHVDFLSDDLSEVSPGPAQEPSQSKDNLDSENWIRDHAFF